MKESVSKNEDWDVECACSEETIGGRGLRSVENESKKLRRSKRKLNSKRKLEDENECQPTSRINLENESCEIFSEHESAAVGGDGAEGRKQRLRCRQHELIPSWNEINRSDVITSCDLTSNSAGREDRNGNQNKNGKRDCPSSRMGSCSASQSTCSEGSYSRRKHHKHHKHKQKSKSSLSATETVNVSPKVNPIFLWVRQEDTRIVEVLCEDYDYRNRLKLRRTHLGWRAIPKTKRFAEAILAKVSQDGPNESLIKPKKTRKIKKGKKKKKEKNSKKLQKVLSDNPDLIKECSVALCRDDLTSYSTRTFANSNDVQKDENSSSSGQSSTTDQNLNPNTSHSSLEPTTVFCGDAGLSRSSRTLVKSNSCDFPSLEKMSKALPRSASLDLNENRNGYEELIQALETKKPDISINVKEVPKEVKCESDKVVEKSEKMVSIETEFDESNNQRNHSEPIVMDMTKHDSDFNDADCDELGQLLKVIPDLEFVEEGELEEVDEEEWSTPTDLTLPKPSIENKSSCVNLPIFPLNISPLITVTSTVRPSEPLTAPLPEVTITPIPKPAHQQKPQNNFLESLLSSAQSVKPESDDSRMNSRKLFHSFERKTSKHLHDNDLSLDFEVKNKKLKAEDITLKSLLSKHCTEKTKSIHLESNVQNSKTNNGEECQKSRLQELLTDNLCSDPISQLKEVLSNPLLAVPDPLLVPRARLPALVASPASEIPRLLTMHLEKTIEEKPFPPITDSDVLEVSLSNLQSLLSSNLEKVISANAQDLANYQKSLEMFLGWQRYQTELMETEMKNSKAMPSAYSSDIADVGTATTLSQMFWLPYLNQFDFNANRNMMSLMNSMLNSECQANKTKLTAPPQINISQVSQPSPFLTPTSPMDIESHLKTLAMWQEAIALQQNSQAARPCSNSISALTQDSRKSGKMQYPSVKKQFYGGSQQKLLNSSAVSCRGDMSHKVLETYRGDYQTKQRHLNSFEHRLEDNKKNTEPLEKYKQEPQNQVKRYKNFGNHQSEASRHPRLSERKKSSHGNISVKPLSNLIDKNNFEGLSKTSWQGLEEEPKKNLELADKVAMRLQQFNTQIQRTKVKKERSLDCRVQGANTQQNLDEVPKLKVKNLVDPNMSPPKLLKQIAPEHLPIVMDEREATQDESQGHLWHPLFGR